MPIGLEISLYTPTSSPGGTSPRKLYARLETVIDDDSESISDLVKAFSCLEVSAMPPKDTDD